MITLREVLQSLDELEELPHNWDTAQKLAVMLVLRDYLSPPSEPEVSRDAGREAAPVPADSEFLQAAFECDPVRVWELLDELMGTLSVAMPRLYEAVMQKLREK